MRPIEVREKIFKLMLEMDRSDDPNNIVGLQFKIEELYPTLVSLTGETRERLEMAILKSYPDWVRNHLRP